MEGTSAMEGTSEEIDAHLNVALIDGLQWSYRSSEGNNSEGKQTPELELRLNEFNTADFDELDTSLRTQCQKEPDRTVTREHTRGDIRKVEEEGHKDKYMRKQTITMVKTKRGKVACCTEETTDKATYDSNDNKKIVKENVLRLKKRLTFEFKDYWVMLTQVQQTSSSSSVTKFVCEVELEVNKTFYTKYRSNEEILNLTWELMKCASQLRESIKSPIEDIRIDFTSDDDTEKGGVIGNVSSQNGEDCKFLRALKDSNKLPATLSMLQWRRRRRSKVANNDDVHFAYSHTANVTIETSSGTQVWSLPEFYLRIEVKDVIGDDAISGELLPREKPAAVVATNDKTKDVKRQNKKKKQQH